MEQAGPYPGNVSVASAIARLVGRHPRLSVEVSALAPEPVLTGVLDGRFDLGVAATAGMDDESRLALEPLPQHEVYLACRPGHPLAGRKRITLDEVLAYPLVAPPLRGRVLVAVIKDKARGRLDPETGEFLPAITVNSLDLARLIAMESDALFPGTASMLAHDVAAGRLAQLEFRIPVITTAYGFVYLRDRSISPAARAFMDELRAVEAELAAENEAPRPSARRSRRVRPSRQPRAQSPA